MCPVAVVTDSTSYLPPELIERERIGVVPLYVVFGGDRTVPEVEITDYPAFFEELRSAEKLPTPTLRPLFTLGHTSEPPALPSSFRSKARLPDIADSRQ